MPEMVYPVRPQGSPEMLRAYDAAIHRHTRLGIGKASQLFTKLPSVGTEEERGTYLAVETLMYSRMYLSWGKRGLALMIRQLRGAPSRQLDIAEWAWKHKFNDADPIAFLEATTPPQLPPRRRNQPRHQNGQRDPRRRSGRPAQTNRW